MIRLAIFFWGIFFFTTLNAQTRIDSFENKINLPAEDTNKVMYLVNYAKAIREKNLIKQDSAKIIQLLQRGLLLSENLHYTKGIASTYIGFGNYYGYYLHQYPLAIEYYKKTLALLKETGSLELTSGKANENISYIYETIGAFPEAITYCNEAVSVYKKLNETAAESRMYNMLGNIYSHINQPNEAIASTKKAIAMAKSINDSYLISYYLHDLSGHFVFLYKQINNPQYLDSALNYLNEAYNFGVQSKGPEKNISNITEIFLNLGNVYKLKNSLPLAKKNLELCIQSLDTLQNEYQLCHANGYLGECYLLEGQYERSEKFLSQALQLAQKINSPQYLAFAYELLYKLYEKKQDYTNAFLYHTKYTASNNSIYDAEKTKDFNNLNIKYETAKKETRIQYLEKDNNYRKKINQFLTALAIIVTVLLGALYYLYKLRRKSFNQKEQILKQEKLLEEKQNQQLQEELKAQKIISQLKEEQMQQQLDKAALEKELEEKQKQLLQDEINFKARELTTNVMHLEKKNELLINIKNHLQELQATNKSSSNEFKELYKLIDSAVQMDDDFNKFSSHFENVHPKFFERLRQRAAVPLTQLDLKLCAFTKMRLSTKEIANLLNVEPRSIRTARYRTKLKFHEIEENDFSDFLVKL
jgi:tetratricopeptide (TPR) repeat protein